MTAKKPFNLNAEVFTITDLVQHFRTTPKTIRKAAKEVGLIPRIDIVGHITQYAGEDVRDKYSALGNAVGASRVAPAIAGHRNLLQYQNGKKQIQDQLNRIESNGAQIISLLNTLLKSLGA